MRARSGSAKPAQALPVKKILLFAIPAVILIIAVIIVISVLGGSGGAITKNHICFFSDTDEMIVSGNNNAKFKIDGKMYSSHLSIDGSKAALLTDYDNIDGGALWFVTPSGYTLIANYVVAYQLADSGNGVAYFTDYDNRNNLATLYLYDTASKKAALITEDALFTGDDEMPGVSISPDGKSVSYISDYDKRSGDCAGYLKIDGKSPEKLGEMIYAVAISDGGKYIYYCKDDTDGRSISLYVRSARNDNRLASGAYSLSMMLNRDYSEIVYNVYDGDVRSFVSRKGNERERISGASVMDLVLPRGTQAKSFSNGDVDIIVYGISAFSGFVAVTDDGLAYYDSRFEANKIAGSSAHAYSAEISNDGKTLYYVNNTGRLSYIDPSVVGAERREIGKNVQLFTVSSDGKSVYFINDDNELYYMSANGVSSKIADDIYTGYLVASYSGDKVFFLTDYRSNRGGELYFSNNGGAKTKVQGADEVMNIWSTPANIFYISRDDELFRSNGNEKFVRFHDQIDR